MICDMFIISTVLTQTIRIHRLCVRRLPLPHCFSLHVGAKSSGGLLAMLWNLEDASVSWVAELRNAYEPYAGGVDGPAEHHGNVYIPQHFKGRWMECFQTPEGKEYFPDGVHVMHRSRHILTAEKDIWDRVQSKSYIASLPSEEQARVKATVEDIVHRYKSSGDLVFNIDMGDGVMGCPLPVNTEIATAFAG
eukprot:m.209882 g.209882  ORF g.209882 m.209882 type:complete len:192 (-) comp18998_c0_seq15:720-1295(-)